MFSQYRGLRKEIYVLCFGRIVTNLGAMVWPMLTMILNQKMGMGAGTISLVMALVSGIMLPVNVLGGRLADHYNKKNVIVICDLISIISYLICAFLPLSYASLGMILIAALCQTMEWPSYNALIADITRTADRERAYSLMYLGGNLGLILSPTIAGMLFAHYLWLSFLISGISIACSTVLIFLMVRDIRVEKEDTETAIYQAGRETDSLRQILFERPILLLFVLIYGLYSGIYQQANVLMPLELGRIHGEAGALIYGSVFSVNCIIVVIFTPLITRWFHRFTEPQKMLVGDGLILIGFAVFLVFLGHIPPYYVSMTIFTWGEIFMMLADSPYTSARIPASHRGRINGLNAVAQAILTAGCQLLIGQLYERHSPLMAWASVYAIGAVLIVLTILLGIRDKKVFPKLYEGTR